MAKISNSTSTPCIVYEYAANGDLFSYLVKRERLPTPIAKFYALQLIRAVGVMHAAQVCHRDLKLDNLVLDSDYNLKIVDFGIACKLSGDHGSGFCRQAKCGTQGYMAPEVLADMKY